MKIEIFLRVDKISDGGPSLGRFLLQRGDRSFGSLLVYFGIASVPDKHPDRIW